MAAIQTISVIGAGAWGTALANAAARAGRDVILYGRDTSATEAMTKGGDNPRLPGIALAKTITATSDLAHAAKADALMLVTPAQHLREAATALRPHLAANTPIIVCAKGIERGTHKFMTEIVADVLPAAQPAILSGPSFASDVARGLPTAVTLAAHNAALAAALTHALGSDTFRPYHTTDVRGVEIGGAAKNVLAIAAGIVQGKKLGASALAALTARGFAELMRLGLAYGAKPETMSGLSGLGDLVLSCSSTQSRNFSYGIALGRNETPARDKLSEGEFTAPVLLDMARAKNVDMPISAAVAAVIAGSLSVDQAIVSLMARPIREE